MTAPCVLSTIRSAESLRPASAPLGAPAGQCAIPMLFSRHPGTHPGFGRTPALSWLVCLALDASRRPDFEFQCQLIDLGPCHCRGCRSIGIRWLGGTPTLSPRRSRRRTIFPGFVRLATARLPLAPDSRRRARSKPRLEAASSGSCRVSRQLAWEMRLASSATATCAFAYIERARS